MSLPGDEGKWFAAAKAAGMYEKAIELANRSHCDPKTLIRAARDMSKEKPQFAMEAGLAALRWLVQGYGYEITTLDVRDAYNYTMKAAVNADCLHETFERIRIVVAEEKSSDRFVTKVLGSVLGLQ